MKPRCFVLDGELAIPTEDGFSLDLLVNRLRLRVTGERFQRELKGHACHLVKDDPTSSRRRGTISDWEVISEGVVRRGYVYSGFEPEFAGAEHYWVCNHQGVGSWSIQRLGALAA